MVELLANSGDSDQTPRSAASDLDLQCLPVTRLGAPVFNGNLVFAMIVLKIKRPFTAC